MELEKLIAAEKRAEEKELVSKLKATKTDNS